MHDVALAGRIQQRRILAHRQIGVDRHRQGLVQHLDGIQCVFGLVAITGYHQRHRLADIAHAIHGQCPVIDGRLDADQEGLGLGLDLAADQHRRHARTLERCRGVDGENLGMGMRRTQDGGVQRVAAHRQVVAELGRAGEQGGVLGTQQGLAQGLTRSKGGIYGSVHTDSIRKINRGKASRLAQIANSATTC